MDYRGRGLVLAALLLACKREPTGAEAPAAVPDSATPAVSTPPPKAETAEPAPPAPAGAAQREGPALPAELAEVVRSCPDLEGPGLPYCPAFSAWKESGLAKNKNSERELIPLLGDPRLAVRRMVAQSVAERPCFEPGACAWGDERALAERVLEFAETEQDSRASFDAGAMVAKIGVRATGLGERVETFLMKAASNVAQHLLTGWMQRNPDVFPKLLALTSASEPHLRKGALAGLGWALGGERHREACTVLLGAFTNSGEESQLRLVVEGFRLQNPCVDSWDAFLGKAEVRVRELTGEDASFLDLLWTLHRRREANERQKARVLAIARSVAASPLNHSTLRVRALSFAARHEADPAAYLRRFEQDRQPAVRRAVKELSAELKGQR